MSTLPASSQARYQIDEKTWAGLKAHQRQFLALWEQWAPPGLPQPIPEVAFAKETLGRRWQSDIVWPDVFVILEFEGGIWARQGGRKCPTCGQTETGAHGRAWGILRDITKYNAAAALNWLVFRVPVPDYQKSPGTFLDMAVQLVEARLRQVQAYYHLCLFLANLEGATTDDAEKIREARALLEDLRLRPYTTDVRWAEDLGPKSPHKRSARKRK